MSADTRGPTGDRAKIDAALSRFLTSSSDEDLDRLVAWGPDALNRLLELSFDGNNPAVAPLTPPLTISGREAVEAWSGALHSLANAFPEVFLDKIDRGHVTLEDTLLVVTTLRGMEGTRACRLLCQFAEHPDYLVRYQVISGLQWRGDEAAAVVVEAHLLDPSLLVRLEAIRGVARRNPAGARSLLEPIVNDESAPGLLRADARRMLSRLDSGG